MARIKLELPEKFVFQTEISVRISDINYGGHLANDAVLSIIHEARIQFFAKYGWTELDVDGAGIIMTDCAVVYKSESFYGDRLIIEVAVADFFKYGYDLFYKITNKENGKDVAFVKTGIMFMDYKQRKRARVPEKFYNLFYNETQT